MQGQLSIFRHLLAAASFCAAIFAVAPAAHAADNGPVSVEQGVSYEYLDRWDVDKLNEILTKDTPAFAGITETYTPARNAVKLYRVTYPSVIPERGNKPTVATGLLAVPDVEGSSFPSCPTSTARST